MKKLAGYGVQLKHYLLGLVESLWFIEQQKLASRQIHREIKDIQQKERHKKLKGRIRKIGGGAKLIDELKIGLWK